MSGGCAGLFVEFQHDAVKFKHGSARCKRRDFHVLPGDAARPTRAKRLQRGFFSGETCGIMLCCDSSARVAVIPLLLCEDALGKARRALQDFAYATNFDNVYADGNNHGS